MRKKGFTLIELLAVMVILGIIALISVPVILNIIADSRKGAFKTSVQSVFIAFETYELQNGFSIDGKVSILDLPLTHKENFISGKVNKEGNTVKVEKVSNGAYCVSGTVENLQLIDGNCDLLDNTPPVINNVTSEVTTSGIKVYTTYTEEESFLSKHEYRIAQETENIEEKEWTGGDTLTGNLSTKSFTGLTLGTTYKIQVRLTNTGSENTVSEIKEITVTTLNMEKPVIILLTEREYATSKEIKLVYPEGIGLTYEYSLDGKNWISTNEKEKTLTIEENKRVRARVNDGTNHIYADDLMISGIDKTIPEITIEKGIIDGKNVFTAKVEPESTVSGYYYIWYKNGKALTGEINNHLEMANLGIYNVKVVTGAGIEAESNKIGQIYTAKELLENAENVLAIDPDQNLRYVGSNPNNYVSFNNELWRIVGVFDGQAKMVRTDNYFTGNFDESNSNDWTTATLQKKLNEDFLANMDEIDKSYVDVSHIWNLGGIESDKQAWTRENLYQWERGIDLYKEKNTWEGAIGLLYPSDFGYSTSSIMECTTQSMNLEWRDSDCKENNWLIFDLWYWTLTPLKENTGLLLYVNSEGFIEHHYAFYADSTFPALYLKSEVKIISGTGESSDPYLLGM